MTSTITFCILDAFTNICVSLFEDAISNGTRESVSQASPSIIGSFKGQAHEE